MSVTFFTTSCLDSVASHHAFLTGRFTNFHANTNSPPKRPPPSPLLFVRPPWRGQEALVCVGTSSDSKRAGAKCAMRTRWEPSQNYRWREARTDQQTLPTREQTGSRQNTTFSVRSSSKVGDNNDRTTTAGKDTPKRKRNARKKVQIRVRFAG